MVSGVEPCTLTVANTNNLSGVRLSFCDNTGASLMRVTYPNRLYYVEMLNNYYDVQAEDDVLVFSIGSRLGSTTTASFMWEPTPN
jgi:hypothetical protein